MEARVYPQPLWTGAEDISGKTLFCYIEQGLGDGFSTEVKEAWATAYGVLSRAMMDAAREQRLAA